MSRDREWRENTERRAFEFDEGKWNISAWHLRELVRELTKRVDELERELADHQRRHE